MENQIQALVDAPSERLNIEVKPWLDPSSNWGEAIIAKALLALRNQNGGFLLIGFGTWYLAYKYPDRFAAIAPMSAPFVVNAWASRLKDIPIWAFHGEKDDLVPISDVQDLISSLKSLGNDPRFTVLPNRDHYILDSYLNQELYTWFLQHSRTPR
jgi:predicted esterase